MNIVLVIPCYNEAKRFETDEYVRFGERNANVSFVFVNDGSVDGTADVLEDAARRLPLQTRIHSLRENAGKAEAVRQGVLLAQDSEPDAIGYWDSDLSTPLQELHAFVDSMGRSAAHQLVIGSRVKLLGRNVQRKLWRHYPGRVFATVVSSILNLPVYDTQCGAKLFRNGPLIQTLFGEPFRVGWTFDVELLARLGQSPYDARECVVEQPLETWTEVSGSKLRPSDSLRAIGELWTIWRSYRPRSPLSVEPVHRQDRHDAAR